MANEGMVDQMKSTHIGVPFAVWSM
jgi:hypothetical protein